MRDNGKLTPGTWYRITDYHTTVSPLIPNARSAGHQFDIIVRADDASHLNEMAYAARHEGDSYFAVAKLEAWELKYSLDNEKWSQSAGVYIEDDSDGYHMRKLGTTEIDGTTYILWDASEYTEDYEFTRAVSEDEQIGTALLSLDSEGAIVQDGWTANINSKTTIENDGQGTITMMKDEHGNQCPYDFKNIQFKRWAVTDSNQERIGLNGNYMAVLNNQPPTLSIEDEEDFIWAYTFSSDATGSEDQVDYSLDGTHFVYDNVMDVAPDSWEVSGLNANVFYGENNYSNRFDSNCYYNTFGNSCYNNTFGNNCYNNTFGNNCNNNTFGNYFQNNSFGNGCSNNTFGNNFQSNSFGNNCFSNSFGNNFQNNSFGNDCNNNTFGNYCRYNTFGNYCQAITVFDNVQACSVTGGTQQASVKNAQILNGTAGASAQNKLTIAFAANKTYTQIAAKNSSGTLKIWAPADLVE